MVKSAHSVLLVYSYFFQAPNEDTYTLFDRYILQ